MAGNTGAVDELVDPIAIKQIVDLKTESASLRAEMVQLLKTAIELNSALGGSTSSTFAKNAKASTDATEKIIANTNKLAEIEAKKSAAQETALNKYLVNLSKQETARQTAYDKELADAEKQAAKLAAIQARKDNTQFPVTTQSNNPVTQNPDSPMAAGIANSSDYEGGQRRVIESTQQETAAFAEQKEVLDSLSTSYRANLELLLALQVEQAENKAALKELTVEDAASGERQVFLTAEQLRLKTAIQQTNLTLSQQTKQMLAEDTSGAVMQSRLDELRVAIQNLSKADLENVEIGGVMIEEANRLDLAIKELRDSTGDHTKHVGDYARAQLKANGITIEAQGYINSLIERLKGLREAYALLSEEQLKNAEVGGKIGAEILITQAELDKYKIKTEESSAATAFAEKVGAKFVSQLVRMAAQFLLLTVVFGTITWLYDLIKNLDIFTGRLDQAVQNLKALNEVMKSADNIAGDNIANLKILYSTTTDVNVAEKDRIEAAETLKRLYPDLLKGASDQSIMNGEEAKSIDAITTAIIKEAQADAALSKIKKIEAERLDIQFQREKEHNANVNQLRRVGNKDDNFADGTQIGRQSDNAANTGLSRDQRIAAEKQSIKTQEQIQFQQAAQDDKVLAAQEDFLVKFAGKDQLLNVIDKGGKPPKAPSDKDNRELLEYYKLLLEEQQKQAKIIVDNDEQAFSVRKAALQAYLNASRGLVENAQAIALDDQNISAQKRKNINLQFHNQMLDVDRIAMSESERLQKEELEKQKQYLAQIVTASKESEQSQLQTLDNGAREALRILTKAKDDKENILSLQRAKGLIDEKEYSQKVLAINDQFAIDRIAQELVVQQSILTVKQGQTDSTKLRAKVNGATPEELAKIQSGGDKDAQPTKDKISQLGDDLDNAKSKQSADNAKSTQQQKKDEQGAEIKALEDSKEVISDVNDLADKGYENQISKLQKIGSLIDENATIEKNAVDRSLDTQSNKARRLAIIDAETASQHKALQEKINQEKRKQAEADKIASIGKIIASTAEAAIKAPAELGPILGALAVPAVLALGAAQIAKVVATPIPQFAKGGTHKGGLLIYGEKGPERIEEPGKTAYYSPGVATLAYAPAGTKITPNHLLPETPRWNSSRTDSPDVVAAVKENTRAIKSQPKPANTRLSGWVDAQRQADAWNKYSTNHFK